MMRTLLLALLVWDCTAKTCLLDHGYSDTGCASGTGVDMDIKGYVSGEANTISAGGMNMTTTWTCLGNGNATKAFSVNNNALPMETIVADGACVTTAGMMSSTYTCGDCALAKTVLPDQWYVGEVFVLPPPLPSTVLWRWVSLRGQTRVCVKDGFLIYALDLFALPWRSSTEFHSCSIFLSLVRPLPLATPQ